MPNQGPSGRLRPTFAPLLKPIVGACCKIPPECGCVWSSIGFVFLYEEACNDKLERRVRGGRRFALPHRKLCGSQVCVIIHSHHRDCFLQVGAQEVWHQRETSFPRKHPPHLREPWLSGVARQFYILISEQIELLLIKYSIILNLSRGVLQGFECFPTPGENFWEVTVRPSCCSVFLHPSRSPNNHAGPNYAQIRGLPKTLFLKSEYIRQNKVLLDTVHIHSTKVWSNSPPFIWTPHLWPVRPKAAGSRKKYSGPCILCGTPYKLPYMTPSGGRGPRRWCQWSVGFVKANPPGVSNQRGGGGVDQHCQRFYKRPQDSTWFQEDRLPQILPASQALFEKSLPWHGPRGPNPAVCMQTSGRAAFVRVLDLVFDRIFLCRTGFVSCRHPGTSPLICVSSRFPVFFSNCRSISGQTVCPPATTASPRFVSYSVQTYIKATMNTHYKLLIITKFFFNQNLKFDFMKILQEFLPFGLFVASNFHHEIYQVVCARVEQKRFPVRSPFSALQSVKQRGSAV